MNDKRSYLDTLNAGRPRRPHTSLEELNRSLETLEQRLDRGSREPVRRRPEPPMPARPAAPQPGSWDAAYPQTGSWAAPVRSQEPTTPPQPSQSGDLRSLRDELRGQITSGLRREFDILRKDIEAAIKSGQTGRGSRELGAEFERLSDVIHTLADRSDDRGVTLLRLELEQVKAALETLAREETLQSVERRWDDFDRRWSDFQEQVSENTRRSAEHPGLEALNEQLAAIGEAVSNLPESLPLHSLEDTVRTLASAIDRFGRNQDGGPAFSAIEQRLDEISRAIVASTAAASQSHSFDVEPFERIEARIGALARQVEEVAADERPHAEVLDRLHALSERVEAMAERSELPERAVERLGRQIELIQNKLDAIPAAVDPERLIGGIERRFDQISGALERSQGDAFEQANALFRDLERRLDEVALRMDERPAAADIDDARLVGVIESRFADLSQRLETRRPDPVAERAIRGLEARLEDISLRLDAPPAPSIDPEVIRNLEAQVAGLSEQLSRPAVPPKELEEIGPRLQDIERSIAGSRETILESARQAAENAVQALAGSDRDGEAIAGLAGDLKALETMTRRSDERNTRTFEAIHDTLLKIVDRLGTLDSEAGNANGGESNTPVKVTLGEVPSIDLDQSPPVVATPAAVEVQPRKPERTPAEAAADAAIAALNADSKDTAAPAAPKRSRFAGLTRAFARKEAATPAVAGAEVNGPPAISLDESLDPRSANRPLAPGSGAPDLNAIMRRVRDERTQPARPADADAGRSDFIAAARRAAQAAAAEAESIKRGADKGPSGKSLPLAGLLGSKRKTLLMAATGIAIALAALQLGRAFIGGGEEIAASEPASLVAAEQPDAGSEAPQVAAVAAGEAAEETDRTAAAEETTVAITSPGAADVASSDAPAGTEAASAAAPVAAAAGPDTPIDAAPVAGSTAAQAAAAAETPAPAMAEASAQPMPPALNEPAAQAATTASLKAPIEAGSLALRQAAEAGDAKAMFEIGSRYAEGRGLKADMAEAAKWYEAAAELGFAPAQYRIGNFNEKGLGVTRDIAKAKTWYQLAANQGNASAMHNLAVLFAMGADGTTDNESAARWFTAAADLGVTDSQFNLGILAAKGVGMQQNLEESYKWFALVAKAGDADAATKRDEVANSLKPDQLKQARAAAELWKPKPLDPEANSVEIPESWQQGTETTASIDMTKAIRNVQAILNKNGYEAGKPDGVMGGQTKAAIKAFQKDNKMEPTGELDEKLVQALLERNK